MAQTPAQSRASKKYHEKFDSILVRVPHGQKAEIDIHAITQGESTNSFIRRAIYETIERDNSKKTD